MKRTLITVVGALLAALADASTSSLPLVTVTVSGHFTTLPDRQIAIERATIAPSALPVPTHLSLSSQPDQHSRDIDRKLLIGLLVGLLAPIFICLVTTCVLQIWSFRLRKRYGIPLPGWETILWAHHREPITTSRPRRRKLPTPKSQSAGPKPPPLPPAQSQPQPQPQPRPQPQPQPQRQIQPQTPPNPDSPPSLPTHDITQPYSIPLPAPSTIIPAQLHDPYYYHCDMHNSRINPYTWRCAATEAVVGPRNPSDVDVDNDIITCIASCRREFYGETG